MTINPYLQHLISDPHFGYLFPHRLALAAYGVPNDYHLRKHYPQLVDGQHYIKIRGTDHVERLFYTLIGLLTLADLVNTPQAQAFKQALIAHTQPAGAIVQSSPANLCASPPATPELPHGLQPQPFTGSDLMPAHSLNGTRAPQPADPAYLVAQYLQPQVEPALERSMPTKLPSPALTPNPIAHQTPQDTAALIFAAQRVASEQLQQTAQTLLDAQRLIQSQQPAQVQVNLNLLKRWDNWLSSQDAWAISLIAAAVVALAGISAYFFLGATLRQSPVPNHSTQSLEVNP